MSEPFPLSLNLPIPIRKGPHYVIVYNVPLDLTAEEAEKIARVVRSYVQPSKEEREAGA